MVGYVVKSENETNILKNYQLRRLCAKMQWNDTSEVRYERSSRPRLFYFIKISQDIV